MCCPQTSIGFVCGLPALHHIFYIVTEKFTHTNTTGWVQQSHVYVILYDSSIPIFSFLGCCYV